MHETVSGLSLSHSGGLSTPFPLSLSTLGLLVVLYEAGRVTSLDGKATSRRRHALVNNILRCRG